MLGRLWNFITGYVIILVEGFFCEKFINIASKRNIRLWQIKRQETGSIFARASIAGFRKMRPVAFKSRCRVKIIRKVGLPFIFKRFTKRKGFLIGMILCVAVVWMMSSIVWTVDVQGDPTLSLTEVSDFVRSMGVYPGVMKASVDRDKIARAIVSQMHDINWAGVSLKGTKLTISLAKRDPKPDMVSKDAPCDVIAAKDGIVKRIIALKGLEKVKPGDTVLKGQVLIAGSFIPKYNEETEVQLHASGDVIASTWYEETRKIEMKEVVRYRTGKMVSDQKLQVFGINIDIFHKKPQYTLYDTITETKTINVGKSIRLPVEMKQDIYYENEVKVNDISFEEAKENAIFEAQKACLKKIPDEASIINKKTEYIQLDDGGLAVKVIMECEENIGVEVSLGG